MPSDWIKMRTDLYRDPKVCMMADNLLSRDGELARFVSQNCQRDMTVTRNVMRNVTVGALVTVWGVTRHTGKRDGDDLVIRGASIHIIDDAADLPGFGAAMQSVGWVKQTSSGLRFPNFFEEYNVDPAEEAKAKNAERQRKFREKQRENSNVTVTLQSNTEERRVEESRVSESESETETEQVGTNGHKPRCRHARDEQRLWSPDSVAALADLHLAPAGNGSALRELTGLDALVVMAWWTRHIGRKPLTGSTGLDLLLVLCWAANCRTSPRAVANKIGAFCAGLKSGEWLRHDTDWRRNQDLIHEHIRNGAIKAREPRGAA